MIRNAQVDQQVIVDCDGGLLVEGVIWHIDRTTSPFTVWVQVDGDSDYLETGLRHCYTLDDGLRLALERAAGKEPEGWE